LKSSTNPILYFNLNRFNDILVLNKYIIVLALDSTIEVVSDFISLFFPHYCAGCKDALAKGETLICSRCILEMPRSNYHLEKENPFYQKLRVRLPVKYVMSLFKFVKAGTVQQILHTLKYKNTPELGQMLGRIYGNDLAQAGFGPEFDLIIPVPLHATKKSRRGYNQSEEFGKGLSESLNILCSDEYVIRQQMTSTQTRKTRLKRWENVKEVFSVSNPYEIIGKKILLVDDVVTTGATLEAVGKTLLDCGCGELSIASIAATQ
jgi:ComF family protein